MADLILFQGRHETTVTGNSNRGKLFIAQETLGAGPGYQLSIDNEHVKEFVDQVKRDYALEVEIK